VDKALGLFLVYFVSTWVL